MFSCVDKKKKKEKTWRKRNTVASSWEWSELWTSERSDGVGRTSEQTLHSFPQPFKQPGVTMETPLCVFPNYPNPLHILSHTHRNTHTKHTQKKTQTHTYTHTLLGWQSPFPLPCIPTQRTLIQSHTVFPSVLYVKRYTDTHSGHEKFLDLVDGPLEFDLGAVVCVLHCDQDVEVLAEVLPVGLPSVHLLLKHTNSLRKKKKKKLFFECTTHNLGAFATEREQDFHFSFFFGSGSGSPSNYTQGSRLSNATGEAYQTRGTTCCSSVVTQDWCCIELNWRFCTLEFFCNISLNLFSL